MVTEAQRQCRNNNVSFPETFRFQYVIAEDNLQLPDFSIHEIDGMWLHIGPELFSAPLYDRNEQVFGYMLGAAADHQGRDPQEALIELIDANDPAAFDVLEEYLVEVAGRYAFFVNIAGQLRAYFDPVGMIGAVFNRKTRRLASSPLLTIDREVRPNPHYNLETIKEGKGGYGLADTADADIRRLNANHYFDLKTFEHKRFWPKESDRFTAELREYGAIYDEIIEATGNVIESMAGRYITLLPLSGGNDSRLLFALAGKNGRAEIVKAFTHINNFANRRDAAVAALICSLKGMPYEIHDRRMWRGDRYAKNKAKRQWRIGSGTRTPAPMEIDNGVYQQILPGSIVMRGHQTNIMRGQYLNFREPKESATDEWVFNMMALAMDREEGGKLPQYFVDELTRYREDLPQSTKPVEADFLFFEILVPAALGVLFHGMSVAFYTSPFNSRRLVQLSMQFSIQHKLANYATHDIIMRAEPDLAALPAANSLPARFEESDELVKERQVMIEQTRARYEGYFGEKPPMVRATAFDLQPYEAARADMRARLGLDISDEPDEDREAAENGDEPSTEGEPVKGDAK